MAPMTQNRLTQTRQRWQKTGQYFGQDGALAQDELLNHAARDMGYLLDLLTNAQALAAPRAPEGPPERPAPLPDDQLPTDREWTDLEWVRNQWYLANEHCDSLEAEMRAVGGVSHALPEPTPQAVEELARKISALTVGRPELSVSATRYREIAQEWLRAAYAAQFGRGGMGGGSREGGTGE